MKMGGTAGDDSVDRAVGKNRREIGAEFQPPGRGIAGRGFRPRHDGGRETDAVGFALNGVDEAAAPAAEPDDGELKHSQAPIR